MKFKKQLNCFDVYPAKLNKKLERFLKLSKKEFNEFFKIKIGDALVLFVNSRKDIDKIFGIKTPLWLVGWMRGNIIFILNPEKYTKESNHKNKNDFWQTLKHELCHIYFKNIAKTDLPKWLNEGLGCYLAGQKKSRPRNKELLKIFKYFNSNDQNIYGIGYFWTKFLIEKYGNDKMLQLLRMLKFNISEKEFAKNFYKIYKIRYSKDGFKKFLK